MTEEKKPFGRPCKYSEEKLELTKHYTENFMTYGDKIPSIEGLAVELDVVVSTIYEWEKDEKKADFSKALCKLRATQARVLTNNGLDDTFNSTITKLMLHQHGYSDKAEVKNTGARQTQVIYVDANEKQEVEDHINSIVEDED